MKYLTALMFLYGAGLLFCGAMNYAATMGNKPFAFCMTLLALFALIIAFTIEYMGDGK